jgi:hypothetical protein
MNPTAVLRTSKTVPGSSIRSPPGLTKAGTPLRKSFVGKTEVAHNPWDPRRPYFDGENNELSSLFQRGPLDHLIWQQERFLFCQELFQEVPRLAHVEWKIK